MAEERYYQPNTTQPINRPNGPAPAAPAAAMPTPSTPAMPSVTRAPTLSLAPDALGGPQRPPAAAPAAPAPAPAPGPTPPHMLAPASAEVTAQSGSALDAAKAASAAFHPRGAMAGAEAARSDIAQAATLKSAIAPLQAQHEANLGSDVAPVVFGAQRTIPGGGQPVAPTSAPVPASTALATAPTTPGAVATAPTPFTRPLGTPPPSNTPGAPTPAAPVAGAPGTVQNPIETAVYKGPQTVPLPYSQGRAEAAAANGANGVAGHTGTIDYSSPQPGKGSVSSYNWTAPSPGDSQALSAARQAAAARGDWDAVRASYQNNGGTFQGRTAEQDTRDARMKETFENIRNAKTYKGQANAIAAYQAMLQADTSRGNTQAQSQQHAATLQNNLSIAQMREHTSLLGHMLTSSDNAARLASAEKIAALQSKAYGKDFKVEQIGDELDPNDPSGLTRRKIFGYATTDANGQPEIRDLFGNPLGQQQQQQAAPQGLPKGMVKQVLKPDGSPATFKGKPVYEDRSGKQHALG